MLTQHTRFMNVGGTQLIVSSASSLRTHQLRKMEMISEPISGHKLIIDIAQSTIFN